MIFRLDFEPEVTVLTFTVPNLPYSVPQFVQLKKTQKQTRKCVHF
jgi:hypothetical protein